MLEELGFGGGLTGGYDGELRSAICGGDGAGGKVLGGVEVFDVAGPGEAEALGGAGRFGVWREGGDAGGAGEEGAAEGLDVVADGSYTT
jgi:hypothetical protein